MKVLVLGDIIVDTYTQGVRRGISAETPTIVAKLTGEQRFLGGAMLVVRNLLRLQNDVCLLSIHGEDSISCRQRGCPSDLEQKEWERLNEVSFNGPIGWRTTEKRRYFVEQYKLLQYDIVNEAQLVPGLERDIIDEAKTLARVSDAVVVCDNRHGAVTQKMAHELVTTCEAAGVPLYVDSQVSQEPPNHDWYRGASHIFVNERELQSLMDAELYNDMLASDVNCVSSYLQSNVILKKGERGAEFAEKNEHRVTHLSDGFLVDAVDTCGAGDAFMAAFVSSKGDLDFANRWAALSTTYKGTVVPKLQDLERKLERR